MSNFFTRLAERTLGLAPTIQPIKPSLFEPEPDAESGTPFEMLEESISPQSSTRQSIADTQILHHAIVDRTAGTTLAEHMQITDADQRTTPLRETTAITPAEVPLARVHSTTDHRAVPLEHFSAQVLPAQGPFSPIAASEPREVHSSFYEQNRARGAIYSVAQNGSSPSSITTPGKISNVTESRSERRAMATDVVPHHMQNEKVPVSRQAHVKEYTTRNTQLAPVAPPMQATANSVAPEPSIQVTIGRIEVRAVATPTTPVRSQQSPAHPPTMSLDEYLRRQEQGGRR